MMPPARLDELRERNAPGGDKRGRSPLSVQEVDDVLQELGRLRALLNAHMPVIASLAVYGENVNVPALVEKARALNKARP